MVLRRRRLCYVIVCICVLDVTSSRNATKWNTGEIGQLLPNQTGRWRYDSNERPLTSLQGAPPPFHTLQARKITPRCNQHLMQSSCQTSTDPGIDFLLDAAIFSGDILNSSSRHPDNSLTSSRKIHVKNTVQSSNKEQRLEHQDGMSKPYTDLSRLSLNRPTLHQSYKQLRSVRGARTNPVSMMPTT